MKMYETITDLKRSHTMKELSYEYHGEVTLMGWIHDISIGGVHLEFSLRDCTGTRKFLIDKSKISKEDLAKLKVITAESVVAFKGKVTPENEAHNMEIVDFRLLNLASENYPIHRDVIDIGDVSLLKKRHLVIRSPKMTIVLTVRANIMRAIREFLNQNGLTEFPSPTIAIATDPGVRTANLFTLPYYHTSPYVLSSSAQLYKQAAVVCLDKVYTIAPSLRLESPKAKLTGRHLSDFWELDVEMAFATYDDVMSLGERLIHHIAQYVKANCRDELKRLNRTLQVPRIPFKRITHKEAVHLATSLGYMTPKEDEISWKGEAGISMKADEPFWVYNYPVASRAWYYRQDLQDSSIVRSMDLLYPEGYGEGITGGEREYDYETLLRRIKSQGDNPRKYAWYVEMFRFGMPPSAGFGLGIERLTRWICGLKYIWEATMFPRVPGVISP